jgi:PAT family beta-lactamase induction signal transducer AmpG
MSQTFWQTMFNKRMLVCIFTGFSSGLPLYVLFQLIPAWLRTDGIDLSTIGLFSIVSFPYTWKFFWSPIMDRFVPPFLGRRRGWMLLTQLPLLILIGLLGLFQPSVSLTPIIIVVALIAFFSASQDIVLDAYRREFLADEELGIGNSYFTNAYRFSSLIPGGLGLILADFVPWLWVHLSVAVFMLVGLVTTLIITESSKKGEEPHSLQEAVVEPFREFINRDGKRSAFIILLFMILYKLGDNMAVALETPFFLDMGFSMTEIGTVAKLTKLWAAIAGSFLGGAMLIRWGLNKCLWLFGFFQILSILGYVALSIVGGELWMLFIAVTLEYLGVGLGAIGLLTYMSKLTNTHFTATQFALFTSIMVIPRTFANASTGFIIEAVGYTEFFLICFACAVPGMLMLFIIAPWNGAESKAFSVHGDA